MTIDDRYQAVQLILSDVDGVLTDGRVIFDNAGIESKRFHIHDGLAIRLWQKAGYRFGVVTGRSSHIVNLRAAELDVEIVRQGVESKLAEVRDVAASLGLELEQVCYLGDDLPDLAAVKAVGLGVAVADACGELRDAADVVTDAAGGAGALREMVERILKAQRRWDDLLQAFE
jgi:YrbI family 3-deoxy-D-manno-octulosonate 8-phosphate phosphatase